MPKVGASSPAIQTSQQTDTVVETDSHEMHEGEKLNQEAEAVSEKEIEEEVAETESIGQESLTTQETAIRETVVLTQMHHDVQEKKTSSDKSPLKMAGIVGIPDEAGIPSNAENAAIAAIPATRRAMDARAAGRNPDRSHVPDKNAIAGSDESISLLTPLLQVLIPNFRAMFRNMPFKRFVKNPKK